MDSDVKELLHAYSSLAAKSFVDKPLAEGKARIFIGTIMRRPTFFIIMKDWEDVIKFKEGNNWQEDIALGLLYKYSDFEVKIPEEMMSITFRVPRMWPPVFMLEIPHEKLRVISALRYVTVDNKKKIIKIFREKKWEELEREILAFGISHLLKK